MALVSKFNDTELKMMENYIDAYAINTDRSASIEYILRIWDGAKSAYLYNMFGNQFIISKPIEFHRGVEEMATELENKVGRFGENYKAYQFLEGYVTKVAKRVSYEDDYELYYAVRSLVDYYSLAENIYHGKTFEIPIPNSDKTIKIQNGCRVSRVLVRIA